MHNMDEIVVLTDLAEEVSGVGKEEVGLGSAVHPPPLPQREVRRGQAGKRGSSLQEQVSMLGQRSTKEGEIRLAGGALGRERDESEVVQVHVDAGEGMESLL